MALTWLAAPSRGPEGRRFVLPIVLLGFYGALWTVLRGEPNEAAVFLVRCCFLALVFLCSLELRVRGVLDLRWLNGVAWTVLLSVIASQAAGRALGVASSYGGAFDFPGLTGEPAIIAASLFAAFPIFFLREPFRPVDALGAALTVISIAGTQRRSALLATALALGIFVAHAALARGTRAARRSAVIILVSLGVVAAVVASTPLGRELAGRFTNLDFASGGTGSGRKSFSESSSIAS